MVSQATLCLCSALFALLISSSLAYTNFYVGGEDGWVINPSVSYHHWARRYRFQVNDVLVFKYKKGLDSVFQVSKEDYHNCRNKKPLRRMTSGESVFQFGYSGSFYFISGKEEHCHKGQKLNVVVAAVGPSPSPLAQPSAPSPSTPPATPSPKAGSTTVPPSPQPASINTPSPSPNDKEAGIAPAPAPSHSWVPTPSCVSTVLAVILISLVMGVSP